ncbi:MAG: VIT1/CCC1 transporter family protein, partial [Gammaproteobacteria bacterium]
MNELDSWHEEQQSAYLYRVLADCEPVPELRTLFIKLAQTAEDQSQHWAKLLTEKGVKLPTRFHP